MLGPNDPPPPEIEEANIFAVGFGDDPGLLMLPRFAMAQIAPDGALVTGDALESAFRAHGARPITAALDFTGDPVPGWRAVFDTAQAGLRITSPDGTALYAGGLDIQDQRWVEQVSRSQQQGRGIVVIAVSAATPDAAVTMLDAGQGSWIRVPVEILT
jgi:hypothetical protein